MLSVEDCHLVDDVGYLGAMCALSRASLWSSALLVCSNAEQCNIRSLKAERPRP